MVDDDSIEERRRDVAVPDPVRVHDDNRSTRAHAKAGSLAALDPPGPE